MTRLIHTVNYTMKAHEGPWHLSSSLKLGSLALVTALRTLQNKGSIIHGCMLESHSQ